jgi:hypothetical protein
MGDDVVGDMTCDSGCDLRGWSDGWLMVADGVMAQSLVTERNGFETSVRADEEDERERLTETNGN